MSHPSSESCSARRADRGFTLVELMVVIVILGGLIAIVGPNVFQALTRGDIGRAETQMSNMANAVQMYYFNNRKLPDSLEELTEEDPKTGEAYMDVIPDDPWGMPYDFKALGGKKFQIRSYGEDNQEGTGDDLVWPKEQEE